MVTKKEAPEVDPWDDDEQPKNPVTVVRGSGGEWASITFKAGSGYNAPWLVLKPSSMEEAKEMVQHEDLSELLDSIARKNKEFERFFGGPAAAAKAPASSGGGWSKPKASSFSERPDDTCPVHNCDLEFVDTFTNPRTQKTTSARMACPVPKCYKKTYWLNDDGTWTLKEQ